MKTGGNNIKAIQCRILTFHIVTAALIHKFKFSETAGVLSTRKLMELLLISATESASAKLRYDLQINCTCYAPCGCVSGYRASKLA